MLCTPGSSNNLLHNINKLSKNEATFEYVETVTLLAIHDCTWVWIENLELTNYSNSCYDGKIAASIELNDAVL